MKVHNTKHLRNLATVTVFALAFANAFAQAQPAGHVLTIGDHAPALEVGSWLNGTPIDKLDNGKTYVVEFWATWCGPCKQSIPHLTELQKKYGDQVTFIGVDSFEPDWSKSSPFVHSMGSKMDYHVATDKLANATDREGSMAKNWMEAAGQTGIPTAFVVRGGNIEWIGNPLSMDGALQAVVSDAWHEGLGRDRQLALQQSATRKEDGQKLLEQFKEESGAHNWPAALRTLDAYADLGDEESQQAATMRDGLLHSVNDVSWLQGYMARENANSAQAMSALSDVASNENEVAALRALDGAQTSVEGALSTLRLRHLEVYLKCGDMDAFTKLARDMVNNTDKGNAESLDHIGWLVACPDQATNDAILKLKFPMGYGNVPSFPAGCDRKALLPLARVAIDRAIALTKGNKASFYDTLAWVAFKQGDKAGAVKAEQEAQKKSPDGTLEQANYEFIGQWFAGKVQK